jgi:hypothetical protein
MVLSFMRPISFNFKMSRVQVFKLMVQAFLGGSFFSKSSFFWKEDIHLTLCDLIVLYISKVQEMSWSLIFMVKYTSSGWWGKKTKS